MAPARPARGPVLLVGAAGQVGFELERALASLGSVVACDRHRLDLRDVDAIRQVVRDTAPGLVVNAAAYTAVDQAEQEPETAMCVNGTAPGILAEETGRLGAALVHYSTDYVFDGTAIAPYREEDAPNPLNVYGRSKLAGERAVLDSGAAAVVLRTSWVYGLRGRNFFATVMDRAEKGEALRIVDDQVGAPTWCRLLAEATAQLLAQARGDFARHLRERRGIYHLSCAGATSWHGFASAILAGLPAGRARPALEAITSRELATPASRPAYGVLDNSRVTESFGIRLPAWEVALELVLAERDARVGDGAPQPAARFSLRSG